MNAPTQKPGTLYVVATPIGNLADITERARRVLAEVALVAAEDTRHSRVLLNHLQIDTPMLSLHEHNEAQRAEQLLPRLGAGESIALISDAGTPLMSDPGFVLVRAAVQAGIDVVAVPGASAILAALSVAGLPTDRFRFEGFLPPKTEARRKRLSELASDPNTLVCFESPRRLGNTLADIVICMGSDRQCVVARELTKLHEQVLRGTAAELCARFAAGEIVTRGEIVLVVDGCRAEGADKVELAVNQILAILGEALPPGQAATLTAKLTGRRRKPLYEQLQEVDGKDSVE